MNSELNPEVKQLALEIAVGILVLCLCATVWYAVLDSNMHDHELSQSEILLKRANEHVLELQEEIAIANEKVRSAQDNLSSFNEFTAIERKRQRELLASVRHSLSTRLNAANARIEALKSNLNRDAAPVI